MIRQTKGPSEKMILNYILAQLKLRYPPPYSLWERQNTVAVAGEDDKGNSRFIRAGTPGQADIKGCHKGRFIELEVKRPGEEQTAKQRVRQEVVRGAGGIYAVCFCPADAFAVVDSL